MSSLIRPTDDFDSWCYLLENELNTINKVFDLVPDFYLICEAISEEPYQLPSPLEDKTVVFINETMPNIIQHF